MKKKRYIKEEKPKWPGKSKEELTELARRLEEEKKIKHFIHYCKTKIKKSIEGFLSPQ
jgi:hypothetical protein